MIIENFGLGKPFTATSRYFSPTPEDYNRELCFYFHKEKILIRAEDENQPKAALGAGLFTQHHVFSRSIGLYDKDHITVVELAEDFVPPDDFKPVSLRRLFGRIEEDCFTLAGRAIQLIHWQKEHRYCGRCGHAMESHAEEVLNRCPNCGFTSFPRISPAVIMSVVDGDRILLARAPHFAKEMYSTLAGFVEPGETLEEAVRREVCEEVGIHVKNVRYMGSQPWPFPHSLMVGFTAEYDSGEIVIDPAEIEDANWFSADNMPKVPSRITIARFLIDAFLASQGQPA